MTYNTLKHGEHTFMDVNIITLGFHMCGHCVSMLGPLFQAQRTTNTLRKNRLSLGVLLVGRSDLGRNDLITTFLVAEENPQPSTLTDSPDMYRAREELRQRLDLHCHVKARLCFPFQ